MAKGRSLLRENDLSRRLDTTEMHRNRIKARLQSIERAQSRSRRDRDVAALHALIELKRHAQGIPCQPLNRTVAQVGRLLFPRQQGGQR